MINEFYLQSKVYETCEVFDLASEILSPRRTDEQRIQAIQESPSVAHNHQIKGLVRLQALFEILGEDGKTQVNKVMQNLDIQDIKPFLASLTLFQYFCLFSSLEVFQVYLAKVDVLPIL